MFILQEWSVSPKGLQTMPSPVRDWAFETEPGDVVKTNATGSFIGQWSCFCYGIMGNLKDTWKKNAQHKHRLLWYLVDLEAVLQLTQTYQSWISISTLITQELSPRPDISTLWRCEVFVALAAKAEDLRKVSTQISKDHRCFPWGDWWLLDCDSAHLSNWVIVKS